MSNNGAEAVKSYALLIGIDKYLRNLLPDGTYYMNLKGCVRDINNVERYLLGELKLPPEQVIKLTASDNGTAMPAEDPALWPTKQNILAAFEKLRSRCSSGDSIYIHYSGHGGRVVTPQKYLHLKGGEGYDEALVPVDLSNSEDNYLRDIELAALLDSLVRKGLRVTIVLDSCHSGGATRGTKSGAPPGAAARSIGVVHDVLPPTRFPAASDEELAAAWLSQTQGQVRSLEAGSGWLPEPKGYVLLAACRASEFAWEYEFTDEGKSGALTYWLLDALRRLGPGASSKAIYDRVLAHVHSCFPTQTPQLQGERGRSMFGGTAIDSWDVATVLKVEADGNAVWVTAGQAQGVRQGVRFDIYSNHGGAREAGGRLAAAEVTEVEHATSRARLIERFGAQAAVESGDEAVLSEVEGIQVRHAVRIEERNGEAAGARADAALEEVARLLRQGSSLLRLAEGEEPASFSLKVNAGAELVFVGASGETLGRPAAPLVAADPNAPHRAVERLAHFAKYRNVLDLQNWGTDSPLANKLSLELVGWQADYTPGEKPEPKPFTTATGAPVVKAGSWVFLRITNRHSQVLNVTTLDLQPDWGICQIFPTGAALFEPLDPGQSVLRSLRANLPDGLDEGIDVVKAFATVGPSNFRILELKPLGVPWHGQARAALRAPRMSILEALFLTLVGEPIGLRNVESVAAASDEWTVTQTEVMVRRN
jgi:hypothetical protein